MRHMIGDDEMSGFGDVGEVHEGPDGNLYEWVEGLSAWGEPVGYWQGLSEVPVQPVATQPAALGALYLASDGSLYQMHGLGEEEPEADASASADESPADDGDDAKPKMKMGPGKPGEIRVGPDGKRYRWVMGMGPGGKRTGFWRRLHPRMRRPAPAGGGGGRPVAAAARRPAPRPAAAGGRKKKPFLKRLLPFAKAAASLIPIPGAGAIVRGGLTLADKALSKKQVAGLGALYQASDGTVYQVQGIDEAELNGFADSNTVDGFSASGDADIDGFAQEDVAGVEDGGDIDGWGEPAAPPIEGDDLNGYIREPQRPTLQAYVPEKPAQTRTFDPGREPPDNWKPLW